MIDFIGRIGRLKKYGFLFALFCLLVVSFFLIDQGKTCKAISKNETENVLSNNTQGPHGKVSLRAGKEYYFPRFAETFVLDHYPVPPIAADKAELETLITIGTVRADQKIDHERNFQRIRRDFSVRQTAKELGLTINGEYFFLVSDDGMLSEKVTVDQAVRASRYIKLSLYLQTIKKAEEVTRTIEWYNKYIYWDATGTRKENVGYRIENGNREEWRYCFSEASGGNAPCPAKQ